jgi:hypothetical protein
MIAHGTYSKYTNHKCRCDDCRKAWTEYTRQRRRKRWASTTANGLPSSVEHGAWAYFNWGCRCNVCRKDVVAKQRAARQAATS